MQCLGEDAFYYELRGGAFCQGFAEREVGTDGIIIYSIGGGCPRTDWLEFGGFRGFICDVPDV